jgi:hypothetical protein
MDIDNFSSPYKPNGELAYPESDLRQQILLPENCFNPLIVKFRCGNKISKINAKEQNETFYPPLSALRKTIEARPLNLKAVLETLWTFYYDVFILADKREFQDFLKFDGIFSECSWFKNSNLKDFPQDLICTEEKLPKKMKFDVFLEKGKCPKGLLKNLFNGRQDKDTTEISTLKIENPFSQILTGEFSSSEAEKIFNNAKDCLNDDEFEAQFRKGKSSKKNSAVVNERIVDGYDIPDYADIKAIPKKAQVITSPTKNGAWGMANILRGNRPDDRAHDYCKTIRTIANKHLLEYPGEFLIHCDKAQNFIPAQKAGEEEKKLIKDLYKFWQKNAFKTAGLSW